MPTGYTYGVVEGTVTDFPKFAMSCARAFGACVTMRDDDSNAPIPEEFKPSEYHAKQIVEARDRIAEVAAMSDEDCEKSAALEYAQAVESNRSYLAKCQIEDARIESMERKVKAWKPPTAEHVEMRDFMLEQLRISKHGKGYTPSAPVLLRASEWREHAALAAQRDLDYHTEEDRKERERAASRTEWVRALRASLTGGAS